MPAEKQSKKNKGKVDGVKEAVSKRVNVDLLSKAVGALLQYHEKTAGGDDLKKKELLGTDTHVLVNFGLQLVPDKMSSKPIRVGIPHPLWKTDDSSKSQDLQEPDVCLIVKEDSKPAVQEMIDRFPEQMGFVKKVLGLDSLRKKHSRYVQQRELLSRFDVFMADDRILPMVGKAIGRNFFRAKKHPIPVKVSRTNALPHQILLSLQATFLHINEGTNVTIRAGYTSMDPKHLTENIVAIVDKVAERIPRKWANIRSVSIKTTNSVALPFYNKAPEELAEIAKMAGLPVPSDNKNKKMATEGTGAAQQKKEGSSKDTVEKAKTDTKEKKKRKAKSPLVESLKKQKKESSSKDNAEKEKMDNNEKKKRKAKSPPVESLKQQKKESSSKDNAEKEKMDDKETPKNNTTKPKPFIAAKKFVQSKKGYVFKMGSKGLGYYLDVKPVVDKMKLEALIRMSSSSGGSGNKAKMRSGKGKGKKRRRR